MMNDDRDKGKEFFFSSRITRSFNGAVRPVGKDVDQNNKTILSRYIHIYNFSSTAR